jgi:hypothetical protein
VWCNVEGRTWIHNPTHGIIANNTVANSSSSMILFAGYLSVYGHPPTMVTASPHGGSRPLFRGVHTAGEYGEGPLFAAWMAS